MGGSGRRVRRRWSQEAVRKPKRSQVNPKSHQERHKKADTENIKIDGDLNEMLDLGGWKDEKSKLVPKRVPKRQK